MLVLHFFTKYNYIIKKSENGNLTKKSNIIVSMIKEYYLYNNRLLKKCFDYVYQTEIILVT